MHFSVISFNVLYHDYVISCAVFQKVMSNKGNTGISISEGILIFFPKQSKTILNWPATL